MSIEAKIDELLKDRAGIERECAVAETQIQRLELDIAKHRDELSAFDTIIAFYRGKASSSTLTNGQAETSSPIYIELEKPEIKEPNFFDALDDGSAKKEVTRQAAVGAKNGKRSFRQVGFDIFQDLPEIYTKRDVAIHILREFPKMKSINENTLRGIMIDYVNDGWAGVHQKSSGRTLQKYKKII